MPCNIVIKRLQLKNTWTISRNSSSYKDNVFIKFEKDGCIGMGEAAPNVRYNENADSVVSALQEFDPDKYNLHNFWAIKDEIDLLFQNQNSARACVDMAILDWVSKHHNMPIHKLLGLDVSHVPLSSFSIGIDTPAKMQQIIENNQDKPVYKIKLGAGNDREIISAIREVTDKPVRVDANEGWKSKEYALEQIHWLADNNIEFVEQPMPADMYKEYLWLKEKSPLPLIADESVKKRADIFGLEKCFDGINIKLMKSGGILEALVMIHMAQTLGLKIMIGCMIESSMAISAAAQIASLADYLDLDGNLLIDNDPYQGAKMKNGYLICEDKPGLGIMEL